MINIVLDTNIIISAALSQGGNPAKIIFLACNDVKFQMIYAVEILAEYDRVLSYKKLNISNEKKNWAINLIEREGTIITPPASIFPMPDESDRIFYDTAKASNAILITGNLRHYPDEPFIMTPSDFLAKVGN